MGSKNIEAFGACSKNLPQARQQTSSNVFMIIGKTRDNKIKDAPKRRRRQKCWHG